jgi:hypothetical protein
MHRPLSSTLLSKPYLSLLQHTTHHHFPRTLTTTLTLLSQPKRKKRAPIDESSWASAQHKPSLGNASFGHLVSELSSTKEGMEHLRVEGETMSEEHRAEARGVVKWLVLGGVVVVGVPIGVGMGRMGFGVGEGRGE